MSADKLPFPKPPKGDAASQRRPKLPSSAGEDVTSQFVTRPLEAAPASAASPTAPPAGPPGSRPLSVTALVTKVHAALANAFPQRVAVVGEISNLKFHTSGHIYFRLKDAGAAIDAAMFRSVAAKLKFRPTDGMEIIAEGRVDVYDVRGQLQFYVEAMTPKGAGALELAFRQLCQKLEAEGLFDPAHKVAIPRIPRAIGLVTSPTGAAIRDIRRTLQRRWPICPVYLVEALVQGPGAAASVARAIALLDANAPRLGIDTIIVARGGGSLEDLWAFNEEPVARAIFAAKTPIICGVGHEVDVSIADMVADVRAATPTAAAEIAVPDQADIARHLSIAAGRLTRTAQERMAACRQSLQGALRSVVFRDPHFRLRNQTQRVDELGHRLLASLRHLVSGDRQKLEPLAHRLAALHPARLNERAQAAVARLSARLAWVLGGRAKRAGDSLAAVEARMGAAHPRNALELAKQHVQALDRQLQAMSYRSVLGRGFSVTRDADGRIVRSAVQVQGGQSIKTELLDGEIRSIVEGPGDKAAHVAPADKTPAAPSPERRAPSENAKPPRPRRRQDNQDDPTLF